MLLDHDDSHDQSNSFDFTWKILFNLRHKKSFLSNVMAPILPWLAGRLYSRLDQCAIIWFRDKQLHTLQQENKAINSNQNLD